MPSRAWRATSQVPRLFLRGGPFTFRVLLVAVGCASFSFSCASFSFCAQSSQHTSTLFPPTVTFIAFASSSQSHAAHVFLGMPSSVIPAIVGNDWITPRRQQKSLSESLAIY